MSVERVHTRLERLCNLLRVEAREEGAGASLLPVQLEALHYLAQCNRYSDTVQGVADYLGQTKGTVSQTLKVLGNRGLLRKLPDANDRRLVHLEITPEGREVLAGIVPAQFLVEALKGVSKERVDRLADELAKLLRDAQLARGSRSFGACRTCRFNETVSGGYRCGLTGEALSPPETELICGEHQDPLTGRDK